MNANSLLLRCCLRRGVVNSLGLVSFADVMWWSLSLPWSVNAYRPKRRLLITQGRTYYDCFLIT